MQLRIGNEQKQNKNFEINIVLRDIDGNPMGKRSYSHDDSYKVWEFYQRTRGKPKKKRKNKIPAAKEANKILEEAAQYAEDKQKRNNNV